ncbi:MAG: hypothetical protein IKR18_08800 [Bacteroidaceae bacterium]|nr:hypothetical protein [Bacteroidaceae bacterium]
MKGKYALFIIFLLATMGFGSCGNSADEESMTPPDSSNVPPSPDLSKIPSITISTAVIPLTFDVNEVKDCRFGLVYSKTKVLTLDSANYIEHCDSSFDGCFEVHVEGLESGTSYFYRSFIKHPDGTIDYGKIESFMTAEAETRSYVNEVVDLHLKSQVKWAKYNVGAIHEADTGNFYSWGEITSKKTHTWASYQYSVGITDAVTKYNIARDSMRARYYGASYNLTYDNQSQLSYVDDVAYREHGSESNETWHIPTLLEWQDLFAECNWTLISINNSNGERTLGYSITESSGAYSTSIFLPIGGYKEDSVMAYGTMGYYWSSDVCQNRHTEAYATILRPNFRGYEYMVPRYRGCMIRPVRHKMVLPSGYKVCTRLQYFP